MELPETVETADGLSVRGPSPELLAGLLQEFEHELSRAGVPVEQALSPGLERDQVGGIFDHLGLPVPDEIAVWFGWHNGVTSLPLWGKAFPRFEFYPIEVVESRYAREGGQPLGYSDREWNPNWIHLLGDNNGMAIECGEPTNAAPHVRPLDIAGEWGTQTDNGYFQVVSLCTPVTWWIESLRKGEYTWHPEARAWDWDFGKPYDRVEKRAYI